jgi:hypothetical protein
MNAYTFRRALKVALLCASKDPMREALNGVLIGADYLEACDGHRLIRIKLPGQLARTGWASRLDARLYLKRLALSRPKLHEESFTGPSAEHLPLSANNEYPDTSRIWNSIVTRQPPSPEVWFNPRYLATLHRISKAVAPDTVGSVSLALGGPTEPALCRISTNDYEIQLVLMPMKKPDSALLPGFKCTDCGHDHQGERFAFICIGCICPTRSLDGSRPPEATNGG